MAARDGWSYCHLRLSFALRQSQFFRRFPELAIKADFSDPVMRGWYFSSVDDEQVLDVPNVKFVNMMSWVHAVGPILQAQMRGCGFNVQLEDAYVAHAGLGKDALRLSWAHMRESNSARNPASQGAISIPQVPAAASTPVETQVRKEGNHVQKCGVCYEDKPMTILLPCGHLSCAACCSRALLESKCPFCRGKVTSTATVFMP